MGHLLSFLIFRRETLSSWKSSKNPSDPKKTKKKKKKTKKKLRKKTKNHQKHTNHERQRKGEERRSQNEERQRKGEERQRFVASKKSPKMQKNGQKSIGGRKKVSDGSGELSMKQSKSHACVPWLSNHACTSFLPLSWSLDRRTDFLTMV